MKAGLLIRPHTKYWFKSGFKFLIAPVLILLIIGLAGFRDNKSHPSSNGITDPLSYYYSFPSSPSKKIKQINIFDGNFTGSIPDSTKKAKPDSTKKALADTTKKGIVTPPRKKDISVDGEMIQTAKPDTTKKEGAKGDKKKEAAREGEMNLNAKRDSVKKAAADTTKGKLIKESEAKAAAKIDTTKIDTISPDVKKLMHITKPEPYIEINPRYKSGFYDPFQAKTQRTIKLDSTGTNVIISETVAGQTMNPPIEMPIQQYLKIRSEGWFREAWERPYRAYEKKEDKKDLQKLMSDFTKVDIPLPSVSFLSIFGEPKIQLEVNGSVKVHAGWRNETTEGSTLALQGNTRNEPDFSQEIQIGLNGKIGDKLTIGADWGTKRNFQYENILKIKYTGYEDEIVQSVEAGNVSMQTSPLIGGSEALFGVKALFQIGPLKLTALASQKRSQSEQKSITNGSQVSKFTKRAWEYSTNHFFIDSVYANNTIFHDYYGNSPSITHDELYVTEIEVWKTTTGIIQQGNERRANAYLDLPPVPLSGIYDSSFRDSLQQTVAGSIIGNQRFVKLERDVDYSFNPFTGVVSFKTLINESEGIAVAYKTRTGVNYGEMAANTVNTPIMVLKMIKPPNLQPSFAKAWRLQLRNIYPLGGKKINKEGFKLYIKYQVEGVEPQDNINGNKLLHIFGFDNVDASGNRNPDNEFDFIPDVTIMPETGEIIFPVLEPFRNNIPTEISDDKYKYDSLYTSTPTMARLQTLKDKFTIEGQYSAATTSTIQIFNAVENSVKVTLDGVELKPGTDFTVEYMGPVAELTIRNPRALVAGANLNISYEQNDMANLASKTMLGLRGIVDINKDTKLGFTAMNLNQQTLSDKVTIGQEPLSNSMYGIDFTGNYELPFLTKLVNNIIPTNEVSKLNLAGDFAYINPDPNTKKSTITGDGGKSIAYIDDFEGSRKVIPIGSNYGGWHDISFPRVYINGDNAINANKMPYKVKVNWFNDIRTIYNVTVGDLYGQEKMNQTSREDQRIVAMDFWYRPDERGYYNRKPNIGDKTKDWGGIMRSLSSTANNLVEENIQYIEFWMHIDSAPKNTKLYIDLGQISEDVIPNNKLDTEDKNMNDAYDPGEDVGLDGLNDADERNDTSLDPSVTDPSNDNYDPTAPDYSKINGTEGNQTNIDLGRLPDSEDLNRNWFLDNVDNFFRYEVPIDTLAADNSFIQGGGKGGKGWYLIRIPLNKYASKVNNPDLRIAETIRFFVAGAESDVHLRFAEINLVGNQWRKLTPKGYNSPEEDETMLLQTISLDDNKNYTSPPGLQQEIDRTKTDKTVYKNEQSLDLVINNLQPGDKREIIKDYSRGLDVFNYKEIRMFVHGDEIPTVNGVSYGKSTGNIVAGDSIYNAQLYFRFGADTTNFYEYRMPVEPGWKDMVIPFAELTAIKQARTRTDSLWQVPVAGKPGHFYGIKGNPTLTSIKFFIVGIVNPANASTGNPITGTVWINELRVLDADSSPGWAYTGQGTFKLADIFQVNFALQNKNPYFHRLADRFGNRTDELSWSLSTEVDIAKFIPFDIPGSSLKLTYTKAKSVSKPLYLFGTDIQVSEATAKLREQMLADGTYTEDQIKSKIDSLTNVSNTTTVTETYSMPNIALRLPADNWFNRDVINGITFGFNYTKQSGTAPTLVQSNSWQWDALARYQIDLARRGFNFAIADIPILGEAVKWSYDYGNIRIHYLPQTISFGLTARRQYKFDLARNLVAANTTNAAAGGTAAENKPSIFRDFTTTRYMEFVWMMTENAMLNLTLKYNLNISGSNAYLLADTTHQANISRSEKDIWRDVFSKGFFGKDFQMQQNFELRANPRLPSLWDINKYFQVTMSYISNYTWRNDFQQGEVGRSALYDATLRFTTAIRWKALTAPLFATPQETETQVNAPAVSTETRRGRGRGAREGAEVPVQQDKKEVADEANAAPPKNDSAAVKTAEIIIPQKEKPSTVSAVLTALKGFVQYALFDYDKFELGVDLENSLGGGALKGSGNGFNNFWGFNQSFDKGPSRLFMLGLSNDLGPRAQKTNTSVMDNFTQKDKISFKTSKTLWEGADIELNWDVSWGLNKSTQMKVEDDGRLTVQNVNATGTIERTFFTIPPVLMFTTLNSGMKKVNELYQQNPEDLSDAFIRGFETLPILSKLPILKDLMKYIPRPNWSFSWQGLEKFPIFSFAKRASITNMYTSNYREGWQITPDGKTQIQQQSIDFGFTPLIGITFSFDGILGGTLNTSLKYNTKSVYTFNAGTAVKNITLGLQNDMDFSASFLKSGFEIPLFGVALKNDIEFSISYTSGRTSNILYKMDQFRDEGEPVDGTIRTKISPRVKYNMSQKVNLSVFYERTTVKPEGASRTPPITTNLAGIDVEIRIGN